jgi:hypothetical protein
VADLEERDVLAAHTDDGARIRLQIQGAQHLADGFELEKAADSLADFLTVIPGERDCQDLFPAESPVEFLKESDHLFLHPAHVPMVRRLIHDLTILIDHDPVDTDRSCVYADVILLRHCPVFRLSCTV